MLNRLPALPRLSNPCSGPVGGRRAHRRSMNTNRDETHLSSAAPSTVALVTVVARHRPDGGRRARRGRRRRRRDRPLRSGAGRDRHDGLRSAGGVGWAAMADVTDASDLRKAIGVIRRALGPIDLLVNNAGIVGPIGPLWEVDADDWWATFDVNLRGIVLASQLVLPEMVAMQRGRIINMSSQAGVHRWPLVSAYSVSKAAVTKLTENLAHETAPSRHQRVQRPSGPAAGRDGRDHRSDSEPTTPYEAHIRAWTLNELAKRDADDPAGRGAPHPAAGRRRRRRALGAPPLGARRPRRRCSSTTARSATATSTSSDPNGSTEPLQTTRRSA